LVVKGGSVHCLVERRRRFTRVALLGNLCAAWLESMVEALVPNPETMDFIKTFWEGSRAFIIQRGSNRLGWYLEVAEYTAGDRRGLIMIPKG
jgi:hypothetical protein